MKTCFLIGRRGAAVPHTLVLMVVSSIAIRKNKLFSFNKAGENCGESGERSGDTCNLHVYMR